MQAPVLKRSQGEMVHLTQTKPHALKLRERCVEWQDPAVAPKQMTLAARDFLKLSARARAG